MGWNQLSEEHFDDSGFSISCIFGISVADLRDNFPTAVMHRDDLHRSFIDFILEQPSFAYFCRKDRFSTKTLINHHAVGI